MPESNADRRIDDFPLPDYENPIPVALLTGGAEREYETWKTIECLQMADNIGPISVFDDMSPGPAMPRMLDYWEHFGWEIIRRDINLGPDTNQKWAMTHMAIEHGYDWFYVSQNDLMYSKDFIRRLLWMKDDYKEKTEEEVGLVAPFRGVVIENSWGGNREDYTYYDRVWRLTGPALLVNGEFIRRHHEGFSTDININGCANGNGYATLCSRRSYCQHMGIKTGIHGGKYDLAADFVGWEHEYCLDNSPREPRKPTETWKFHAYSGYSGDTTLFDDGTKEEAGVVTGTWWRKGNILHLSSRHWESRVGIWGDKCRGITYPGGTLDQGFPLLGELVTTH